MAESALQDNASTCDSSAASSASLLDQKEGSEWKNHCIFVERAGIIEKLASCGKCMVFRSFGLWSTPQTAFLPIFCLWYNPSRCITVVVRATGRHNWLIIAEWSAKRTRRPNSHYTKTQRTRTHFPQSLHALRSQENNLIRTSIRSTCSDWLLGRL